MMGGKIGIPCTFSGGSSHQLRLGGFSLGTGEKCSLWHFSQMTLKLSCDSLDPSSKFNHALSVLYQVREKVGLAKGWKSLTGNC